MLVGIVKKNAIMMSTMAALMGTLVVYPYLNAWQRRLAPRRVAEPLEYAEPGGEAGAAEAAG
jgi:hypothetical protein